MCTYTWKLAPATAAIAVLATVLGAACLGNEEGPPTVVPTPPSQIAYVATDGGLWLVNADGSGKRQVVAAPVHSLPPTVHRYAQWSPNGTKIAYMNTTRDYPDFAADLWVWDDSDGERRLIDESVGSYQWVPGSEYISYTRTGTAAVSEEQPSSWLDRQWDTWVVDAAQADVKRKLLSDSEGYPWWATWSPDGKWFAHNGASGTGSDADGYHRAPLFLVGQDGSQRRKLTDDGVLFPRDGWSPDGRFLAYWKNEHGGSARVGDIYVMDLTAGVEIRLGEFTSDDFPQWAPTKDAPIFHNLRIDPGTDETEELFERPGAIVEWSPDATKVAYVEGHPFGYGPRSLVVLDLNSKQRTTFHTSQTQIPHVLSPGYWGNWSPDGRYFAFTASDANELEASLYVADTTTGAARAVMAHASGSYSPAGDRLLIQREEPLPQPTVMPSPTPSPTPIAVPMRTIWVADPDGSHPVKIADGTAIDGPAGRPGWRPVAQP